MGRKQIVTGLSVSDRLKPRIGKFKKKRLRQIVYYCEKYGIGSHLNSNDKDEILSFIKHMFGWLSYAASIEPEIIIPLIEKWKSILHDQYNVPNELLDSVKFQRISAYL